MKTEERTIIVAGWTQDDVEGDLEDYRTAYIEYPLLLDRYRKLRVGYWAAWAGNVVLGALLVWSAQ